MKLISGVGVNDLPRGSISYVDELGVRRIRKYYSVWSNMILRCYPKNKAKRYDCYSATTVCDEWKLLSSFKKWFDNNYVKGWHLDKDLLDPSVKTYSKHTCRFIPRSLNNLFTDMNSNRGIYKIGVSYSIEHKKFRASLNFGMGNQKHIGYFKTEDDAHECYMREKIKFVISELPEYERIGVCNQLIAKIRSNPTARILRNSHE